MSRSRNENGAVSPSDERLQWKQIFHPVIVDWFEDEHQVPTPPQARAWPLIASGKNVLVAAPTGSGKTLCAFLSSINDLLKEGLLAPLPDEIRVLYVSPLKALSHDIEHNLTGPLDRIHKRQNEALGHAPEIRTAARTGDTTAAERNRAIRRPPHIYVTTPESLYILLTSNSGRRMLSTVTTVIVDEIHALVGNKRGAHLALSLERLEQLTETPVQRIGLSATQRPIDEIAKFLVGYSSDGSPRPCHIVDEGHQRTLDLGLWVPPSPLEPVLSAEAWGEIYDELALLASSHKTTIIFTNTRKLTERITRFVAERLGKSQVASHHGSLSRRLRHDAESRLKSGSLMALVATASLELGIDVGDVDLVVQLGSPGSIATFLQRVGRSGHTVRGTPKGRLIPTSPDDLVEGIALLDAVSKGTLDAVHAYPAPLDILAQQIVATLVPGESTSDDLLDMVRRASPFRELSREAFDRVVSMLENGFTTARGKRGAFVHHDRIGNRLKARRGARLAAITSGGAIPENFDYDVRLQPADIRIGSVHEDFAIEASAGDVFQLGNMSYQVEKVDLGVVRVRDAGGAPPNLPFWLGEAPSRTTELSIAVSELRSRVAAQLEGRDDSTSREGAISSLAGEWAKTLHIDLAGARQAIEHLAAAYFGLGAMPTQEMLVCERFFDEAGGMHVVLHAPFGARVTRGLGLALRKRFCRSFNVELQAAATDNGLILSLGPMHSFPLEEIFGFLSPHNVEDVLVQAVLDSPLFATRWRWNASRALSILRFRGGKRVAPRLQRMQSDDLLAQCFPDQVACLENIAGDREVPDHPLVEQSIWDCLHEAMDIVGLKTLLEQIRSGRVSCIARDVIEPSSLTHELLGARPYAFLDDAPLEERRTQAVALRRKIEGVQREDLGRIDPLAIEQVLKESFPDPRDPDELHDTLSIYGFLAEDELQALETTTRTDLVSPLLKSGRASWLPLSKRGESSNGERILVAAETVEIASRALLDGEDDDALVDLVRGRCELAGPITTGELSALLGLSPERAATSLRRLEGEGFLLRGRFRNPLPKGFEEEFCERRLLWRIHRLTLGRLRREIEPVSPAVLMDFYAHFQGVHPANHRQGIEGVFAVLEQLDGLSLAAGAWEQSILPSRVKDYDPNWLDALCWSGRITWSAKGNATSRCTRATPIRLGPRSPTPVARPPVASGDTKLSADARRIASVLREDGASFLSDLKRASGLLPSQAETALSELIAKGFCTFDGFSGLRTLITPASRRGIHRAHHRRAPARGAIGLDSAGRISLLRIPKELETSDSPPEGSVQSSATEEAEEMEALAWKLLRRWGVIFRRLLERESHLPLWRDLLRTLHRLEARGEIRGGRFVTGFSGEQFALTEAVTQLRSLRRCPSTDALRISAADPLNLTGIIVPGERLPATTDNRLVLVRGEFVAHQSGEKRSVTGATESLSEVQLLAVLSAPTARSHTR
jgi:ATP-dependent Lhr-like helicase